MTLTMMARLKHKPYIFLRNLRFSILCYTKPKAVSSNLFILIISNLFLLMILHRNIIQIQNLFSEQMLFEIVNYILYQ